MTWKLSLGVGTEEENGTSRHMALITFWGHHPEVAALTDQEKGPVRQQSNVVNLPDMGDIVIIMRPSTQ